MFKPARMTRIVAGGHQKHMETFIDILHQEHVLHLEDFEDPTSSTKIGTPLEAGDQASALLVRVRGMLKALDVDPSTAKDLATTDPESMLQAAEKAVAPTIEEVADVRARLAASEAESKALAPFVGMDLDLSGLHGLKSVVVYLGTTRVDASAALKQAGADVQSHLADGKHHVGVIARAKDAAAVEKALAEAGYSAATIPASQGTPKMRLQALEQQQTQLKTRLQNLDTTLMGLRSEWGPRLGALEHHLAAEVDKTQAPLRFAVTGHTFHAEGWVPANKANRLQNAVSARLGDAVYLENMGDHVEAHHPEPSDEPPVKLENKGLAVPYEFLLGLLGKPRYQEIDPTKLMLLFFPLFFGLMVGDIAVGLAIMGLGQLMKTKKIFGMGGPSVGRALVMGGFIAVIAGAFIFGEALGIHFVVGDAELEKGETSWESLIYGTEAVLAHEAGFPTEGFIHKHVSHHGGHGDPAGTYEAGTGGGTEAHAASGSDVEFTPLAAGAEGETSAFSFAPHGTTHLTVNGWFNLGYYSKIHDITALLLWSIVIGVVHIILGLLIGIRNVAVSHGVKLAIQEKVSWLMILASVGMIAIGAGVGGMLLWGGVGLLVVGIALLWQGVAHTVGVGFIAILEVPSLFGNILSYTRLAAIGASKAGMAVAFNAIGALLGEVGGPVWWIIYLIGMAAITLLATLSGGLQSLRLQFVEFFSKFYEGGGRPYVPFGRRSS